MIFLGKKGVGDRGEGMKKRKTEEFNTNWITRTKTEAESVGFIKVERVGVEDAKVHLPFFVIVGGDEADAWRKGLVDLAGVLENSGQGKRRGWIRYLGELLSARSGIISTQDQILHVGELTLPKRFAANMISVLQCLLGTEDWLVRAVGVGEDVDVSVEVVIGSTTML